MNTYQYTFIIPPETFSYEQQMILPFEPTHIRLIRATVSDDASADDDVYVVSCDNIQGSRNQQILFTFLSNNNSVNNNDNLYQLNNNGKQFIQRFNLYNNNFLTYNGVLNLIFTIEYSRPVIERTNDILTNIYNQNNQIILLLSKLNNLGVVMHENYIKPIIKIEHETIENNPIEKDHIIVLQ